MKLRPKWSQINGRTRAWGNHVRMLAAAAMLVDCSDLDPNIGKWRDQNVIADAGEREAGDLDDSGPPGTVSFKDHIRPMLDRPSSKTDPKGCKSCHYRTEVNHSGLDLSGLDLSTLGTARRGGGSSGTRIIVPGKPAESVLVQALKGTYFYSNKMPKNGPYWTGDDIKLVETWIAEGAKGADGE